ncbi:MAG TPA: mechanosensitive ion channel family protein [Methanoregulaceae archaeon]|jgi:small-conductance mechanosensitive channel|nr:mechanosensitive ion channel family protein [Methanolinea sp.]MDD5685314.1 mechanosensitive ion channel family protein [Methanoregulaceae archaeon]HOP66822.1 mechanosensitive ion channel family protein [Methanoregulaceae archaeon]HPJ73725.1 mechanosensitive ion channel family protein [Methanoregulaceae archaeon]HPQ75805.1 mechanosensitive ion channel family protein [Methanoregulaceae archaeon]
MGWLDTVVYDNITYYHLVFFAVVIIAAFAIAKIVSVYLKKTMSDRVEKSELDTLIKIIQVGIILIGVYIGLPRFEFDLADVVLIGGTLTIVIGFATQKVGSNFASGLFLLLERPIKPGDNVRIGTVAGIVQEIHVLSTIVRDYEGIYVRIPNEKVFTSDITNFVTNVARRFEYSVGISYSDDAGLAMGVIYRLLEQHPFILKHPGPSVFLDELADSSVVIRVTIWCPSEVWWSVRTEMLREIKKAIEAEGITIPFPQRVITFANAIPGAGKDKERVS